MAVRIITIGLLLLGLLGCSGPSKANIDLRKEIQDLKDQVAQQDRQHTADKASIEALQSRATTVPVLPEQQIEQLYTTHGLALGKLTGGAHDPGQNADSMVKVYATPTDDDGEEFKAAGSFTVELFDLALPTQQRIGQWDFDLAQSRQHWLGHAMLYEYVLPCSWQTRPTHTALLLSVTFVDALTHRSFNVKREINVNVPAPQTRP